MREWKARPVRNREENRPSIAEKMRDGKSIQLNLRTIRVLRETVCTWRVRVFIPFAGFEVVNPEDASPFFEGVEEEVVEIGRARNPASSVFSIR